MIGVGELEEARALRAGLHETLRGVATQHPFEPVLDGDGFARSVWEAIGSGGWLGVAEEDGIGAAASTLVALAHEVGAQVVPGPFSATMAFAVPLLARGGASTVDVASVVAGTTVVAAAFPARGMPHAPRWTDLEVTEAGRQLHVRGRLSAVIAACDADVVLVPFTRSDGATAIATVSSTASGVTVEPETRLDRAKPTGAVQLDVHIGPDDLLGGWDARHDELLAHWLVRHQLCVSGELVGAAAEIVARTVRYVSERRQFGVPVGSFQAVKHLVAEAHADVELARALVEECARRDDDPDDSLAAADLAACHLVCSRAARRVLDRAVQAHGGMGFTWDHGMQYWYGLALFAEHHPFPARVLHAVAWDALQARALDAAPARSEDA